MVSYLVSTAVMWSQPSRMSSIATCEQNPCITRHDETDESNEQPNQQTFRMFRPRAPGADWVHICLVDDLPLWAVVFNDTGFNLYAECPW